MKVLSRDDQRRPADLGDLRALLAVATPDDIERARELLRLITQRGFARGKDLLAELTSLFA